MNLFRSLGAAVLSLLFLSAPGGAVKFPPHARIYLIDETGRETAIGAVTFSGTGPHRDISVTVEAPQFSDHFLSMRPFRCIQGEKEWFCYLPYPYALNNTVSASDLRDLEYSLLFIRKTPAEFGIDAWNGLYYRLTLEESGEITGELLEGDLNVLASPPLQDHARPIELDEFIEAEPGRRLFPRLVIRPSQP
ncbi:hypothetical protein [Hoeflea sp. TYP-13]|uniref:hypothetical protein n=1 Tax=Hoeflea sp. TYP-13 TaxID=3230023 RepID=UPI0034C63561